MLFFVNLSYLFCFYALQFNTKTFAKSDGKFVLGVFFGTCGTKNKFYWAYMKKKRWIMLQFYGDEKYFSLVLYR